MTTTDLLLIVLVINTMSNIFASYIMCKFGKGQGGEMPDMSDVYQKQLKNYQNIIKLNEKLIKEAMSSSQQTDTTETTETTETVPAAEERRIY